MNPPMISAAVLALGLPELYRVALGIGQPGEASVRVDLRVHVDRDASFAKLRDHLIEVADAEIDHPLEPPVAKVRRILLEGCEGGGSCAGPPRRGTGILRDRGDAEIGLVPLGQFPGSLARKKNPPMPSTRSMSPAPWRGARAAPVATAAAPAIAKRIAVRRVMSDELLILSPSQ